MRNSRWLAFGASVFAVGIGASACMGNPKDLEGTADSEIGVLEAPVVVKDEAGKRVEPLTQVEYASGARVGFFEAAPGDLTVMQWGPNGVEAPIDRALAARHLSATELYRELTGDLAPYELVMAQQRREERLEQLAEENGAEPRRGASPNTERPEAISTTAERSGDLGVTQQAVYYYDCEGSYSYDEWFNCSFCAESGDFDYTWMWVTGSGDFYQPDRNHIWTTVSVYGGASVHFRNRKRTWYSWNTLLDTFVANGFWAQTEMGWDYADFDVSSAVDQASGDSYHWCGYGWST